ncbi:hypothetical protein N9L76_05605 [bacterium]|nr:hypothetical protein [bacterium]
MVSEALRQLPWRAVYGRDMMRATTSTCITVVGTAHKNRVPRRWHTVVRAQSPDTSTKQKGVSSPENASPFSSAKPGDRIALTTMPATRPTLGVSAWPDFDYDASGATTLGAVDAPDDNHPDAVRLRFDVRTFQGVSVNGKTTAVFGVPLPPGVNIDIVPVSLHGWLDPATGACALDFDAQFRGSIFGEGFIKLPPMTIRAPLTTGEAKGMRRVANGKPFGAAKGNTTETAVTVVSSGGSESQALTPATPQSGEHAINPCLGGVSGDTAELVSVAIVPKVEGPWAGLMNFLLQLPNDALAVLPCRLRIWSPDAPGVEAERAGDHVEAAILRNLDSRFEYRKRRDAPVECSKNQMDLALLTFGAATFVEENFNLYV